MITFFLPGEPPHGTSQQKGVSVRHGKPHFFKRGKLAQIEAQLTAAIRPHAPAVALTGPVRLSIVFVYGFRKSDRSGDMIPHTTRPDAGNSSKLVEDVLTRCGFWGDDAQVADLHVIKVRGESPGISITVAPWDNSAGPSVPVTDPKTAKGSHEGGQSVLGASLIVYDTSRFDGYEMAYPGDDAEYLHKDDKGRF